MLYYLVRDRVVKLAVFMLVFMSVPGLSSAQTINFGSVALEGTTPVVIMHKLDDEVKELTGGKVSFKIRAGNVGDELDIIAKMRRGRIHAAGFTGLGLGEILPEMRIMEIPFLFRNVEEIDYVIDKLYDRFAKGFEEKGYVLLGWAEAGIVHFFSTKRIASYADLEGVRMWTWQGDKLALEMFKQLNLVPNPLPLTDVATSLQTGLIDAVYVPPYHAIGLQWAQKAKYMNKLPVTNAAGAIIMLKESYDKLSPEHQKVLSSSSKKWLKELVRLTRKDNKDALAEINKIGVELVEPPTGAELKIFTETGIKVREALVDVLYPRELLDKVIAHLEEFRASNK